LVLDINMLQCIDWPENDFASFGPGSKEGLKHIFCDPLGARIGDAIKYLHQTQYKVWKHLGITAIPSLDRRGHEQGLSLPDIEHSLCEFAKYMRLKELSGKATVRSGSQFKANSSPLSYCLPSKWRVPEVGGVKRGADIAAEEVSSEPGDSDDPNVYEVSHIVAQRYSRRSRKKRRKVVQYRVRWVGYESEDDTWLDEDQFENAKDVLANWKSQSS